MDVFKPEALKSLYVPPNDVHKPQNGSVMLIGGSQLFHAASLWALTVISRIVDMAFYSSVKGNNEIVQTAKSEFKNGIVVPRESIDSYINEADCILIGPGLPRLEGQEKGDDDTKTLTESLLKKYPSKKWVIDGGSLQVMNPEVLLNLKTVPILTPHRKEFEKLFNFQLPIFNFQSNPNELNEQIQKSVGMISEKYNCVILLKGENDIVCQPRQTSGRVEAGSPTDCVRVEGGNSGMTKGGTGDVLAGLVAALYAKNDAFLSATAASYINKKAGDRLFERVGYYFNASDLADEIPKVMKESIIR